MPCECEFLCSTFTARGGVSASGFSGSGKSSDFLFDASVQFTCIAVDSGGELLVAGSQGSVFSAFVWSIKTAKLLEQLTGHEAPVVAVAFHPHPDKQGVLVTGSWDKKVKVGMVTVTCISRRCTDVELALRSVSSQ